MAYYIKESDVGFSDLKTWLHRHRFRSLRVRTFGWSGILKVAEGHREMARAAPCPSPSPYQTLLHPR